jgi:hypothetical protein
MLSALDAIVKLTPLIDVVVGPVHAHQCHGEEEPRLEAVSVHAMRYVSGALNCCADRFITHRVQRWVDGT